MLKNGKEITKKKSGCVTEIFSRVSGFYRPVKDWNPGKKSEFHERKKYKGIDKDTWDDGKLHEGDV